MTTQHCSCDDIVTLLRERVLILFREGAEGSALTEEKAANEIERLRARLKMVEEDRDYYRELLEEYENDSESSAW